MIMKCSVLQYSVCSVLQQKMCHGDTLENAGVKPHFLHLGLTNPT